MWWCALLQVVLAAVLVSQIRSESCSSSQKLCPNGACVDMKSPCPQVTCRTVPRKCHDGDCQPKHRICEQKKCRAGMKPCPDGTCIYTFKECPPTHCPRGLKPCDDGTCVLTTMECVGDTSEEDDCTKRCKDNRCIDPNAYCPEDLCPYWKNNKCDDGNCFTKAERCNGIAYCADESDEKDCEEYHRNNTTRAESLKSGSDILAMISNWPWWVYVIAVGLFVLLCLIIALCCRYQNKQARARRLRRAQRSRRNQQGGRPFSQEMPDRAGRRTQPVPTGGAAASTPMPAAYQPLPTQAPQGRGTDAAHFMAPSPYNPSYNQQAPFPQSHNPYIPPGGAPGGHPGMMPVTSPYPGVAPSAPPLGMEDIMEAPPPYSEAIRDPSSTPQPGVPKPYLPSYDTVQRGGVP